MTGCSRASMERRRLAPALLLAVLALAWSGCSLRYGDGQALEQEGRWEEAMLAYRDAVIDFPSYEDYRAALDRARKVVARDNYERYKAYLADKSFRKAYARLVDASRQDPDFAPVQQELDKWQRVLVGGQIDVRLDTSQTTISLAEEINLMVRINTPNPGETLDAKVNIDDGTFFAEDLLYNRPSELLTLYSINSIGVELVYGRTRIKQFTSKDFQRFINVRTPIVDAVDGALNLSRSGSLKPIAGHRTELGTFPIEATPENPPANPHYSLHIEGTRIEVRSPPGSVRPDFTPRFLYMNQADQRYFVDFGRYEVSSAEHGRRWNLRRLPLVGRDYFPRLSRNVALQPYFFYREGVFTFVPSRSG